MAARSEHKRCEGLSGFKVSLMPIDPDISFTSAQNFSHKHTNAQDCRG